MHWVQLAPRVVDLSAPEWAVGGLPSGLNQLHAVVAVAGSGATPARLDLVRTAKDWAVTRVRH